MTDAEVFEGWYIVEQMGHKKLAGFVREVTIAGAGFLRVDVPESGDRKAVTQIIRPETLYAMTPVSEELARRVAVAHRPEPVHAFEVREETARPALAHRRSPLNGDGPDHDDDPDMEF